MKNQAKKAERFLALHHDPELLVLPNIWDPLGARMLERTGYPAVATASAAVAYSLGYADGQRIRFETMLDVIRRIAASVEVPLTADIESGYAETPGAIAANVARVVDAGAVGINIEDGITEGGPLLYTEVQCDRIRAIRKVAQGKGIPLVINARTDVFLGGFPGDAADRMAEATSRAKAYVDAGADCIYPIGLADRDSLAALAAETRAPINVYAWAKTPTMRELEAAGVRRLSIGPGLIKASLTAMRQVARDLLAHGSYDAFTRDAMSSDEIAALVSDGPEKGPTEDS